MPPMFHTTPELVPEPLRTAYACCDSLKRHEKREQVIMTIQPGNIRTAGSRSEGAVRQAVQSPRGAVRAQCGGVVVVRAR